MANIQSAKKRIRRNARRADINGVRRSRIRTFIKNVEVAIAGGDAATAQTALQAAQPEMQRGVAKGLFHKKTVSRKISRMSQAIKSIAK